MARTKKTPLPAPNHAIKQTLPAIEVEFNPAALAGFRPDPAAMALKDYTITTDTEAEQFAAVRLHYRDAAKAVKKMKDTATGPLKELRKVIDGWFRDTEVALAEIDDALKAPLDAYALRKAEAQRAAAEQARVAARVGDMAALTQAVTVATAPSAPVAGTSTRTRWKARVINAGLMPYQVEHNGVLYSVLMPDEKALDTIAASLPADLPDANLPIIPGVKFELIASVGVRS